MDAKVLRIIGVTLWWAEGSKSRRDKRWKNAVSYPIEITNTDPLVISYFLRYITEIVGIPHLRLRLQLQIHANDDQEELEAYWSRITNISRKNFNRTIVRPIGNKPGKSKGTCKIRCNDKVFYGKIVQDLELVLQNL